jgi:hypothetical protein
VRVDPPMEDVVDRFLSRKRNGAPLTEIYDAVFREIEGEPSSVRRILSDGAVPRGTKYLRVRRGIYRLAAR